MSVCAKNPDNAEAFKNYPLVYAEGKDSFRAAAEETIAAAKELGVQTVIVTVGNARNDVTRYEQHTNIVKNIRAAAPLFEDSGIILVVEPLNVLCDHKGYYLDTSYEGFGIIEEIGSPNVRLLFDIYHQQISEGNIIPTVTANLEHIAHLHGAGHPGRHELQYGESNYRYIIDQIDKAGYKGSLGLEYSPILDPIESLRLARELFG